jgi:phospholipid/cholesterol/gamma-HCH transport system permease protein
MAGVIDSLPVPTSSTTAAPAHVLDLTDDGGMLRVTFAGQWRLEAALPDPADAMRELEARQPTRVVMAAPDLRAWDSGLLLYAGAMDRAATARGIPVDYAGLPAGLRRLLRLLASAPERKEAIQAEVRTLLLERIGRGTLAARETIGNSVEFLGVVLIAMGRFFRGRATYRRVDLVNAVQQAGIEALGVVGLINVLLGMILAFVGATQLEMFGATVYTANLVGIAMVRDMSALMTAIVMAGRSGASYAASIGTMQTNQEIDALTTLGISPIEYLVTPRIIALVLMMPLLTLYADFIAILGGAFVGVALLDFTALGYYQQTISAVKLEHLLGGLLKALTYGFLVAATGTYQGIRAARSAAGVGNAATTAVVLGIVGIVAAAGIYAVLFFFLGW